MHACKIVCETGILIRHNDDHTKYFYFSTHQIKYKIRLKKENKTEEILKYTIILLSTTKVQLWPQLSRISLFCGVFLAGCIL